MTPTPPATDLDPRLAELARVLGRALARRRLRAEREPAPVPDPAAPPARPAPPTEENEQR